MRATTPRTLETTTGLLEPLYEREAVGYPPGNQS